VGIVVGTLHVAQIPLRDQAPRHNGGRADNPLNRVAFEIEWVLVRVNPYAVYSDLLAYVTRNDIWVVAVFAQVVVLSLADASARYNALRILA
jgi:hypothetical protein